MTRALGWLLRGCDGLAMLAAALLLAVVAGAILARLLFDLTGGAVNVLLSGAIELSRYALLVTVLAALPGALASGLVRVDLLIERLPAGLAALLERLWHLLAAAIGGVALWRLAIKAADQAARGDLTQDLGLPLWPVTAFAAAALGIFALTGLACALGMRPGR
ncbi:hypothetical protein LNKW23_25090 [Paralimibaculum aggregatum]|uniref:TRAP transporter small permease protein n=1 Tax=Paralimibaculum aggregatum TaxID=3036245 RepID=A0ABQ6LJ40_9RHOB|nr:TRAP transporter small permease [Limibaculum sp. NKW23]GMG83296.1 hypothetical protein LNKW23_25090 [Limibaculum sp. NKW23]